MLGSLFPVFKGMEIGSIHENWSSPDQAGHRSVPGLASGWFAQGTADMLRAVSLAVLMVFAAPSFAAETPSDSATVAQQKQAPPQSRKRDCEKKQDEGVS
jgi:hypothetical protein